RWCRRPSGCLRRDCTWHVVPGSVWRGAVRSQAGPEISDAFSSRTGPSPRSHTRRAPRPAGFDPRRPPYAACPRACGVGGAAGARPAAEGACGTEEI
ncbi:hypothetical protein DV515_00000434, partial [Chloebia gouldiae]